MTASLDVRSGAEVVGRVRVDDNDRFAFVYEPAWLGRRDRFPVSLSLPLRSDEYVDGAAHAFFANLLPEGGVRQAVCARLGISVDNDFALLRAIGGECAGALSLVDPDVPSRDPDKLAYEELTAKRVRSLVEEGAIPLLIGGPTTRLSLAGAQDKVPLAWLDGKLYLPLDGAPSTHILKLPNPRYAHLPANEAFSLELAGLLGFEVVSAELFVATNPPGLLVARYDRVASDDPWPARRLHQEDLCQATGLPPTRKYEAEGGLDLVRAATLVRDNVDAPLVDLPRVLRWQAFNIVLGNSDGHAKNLSVIHDRGTRLAPFHDLVSTRQYAGLDRKLAMGVGGRQNPDEIGRAEWLRLSEELGVGSRVVIDLVREVAQGCLDSLPGLSRAFKDRHGKQPILETLPTAISRRARRVLRSLETR